MSTLLITRVLTINCAMCVIHCLSLQAMRNLLLASAAKQFHSLCVFPCSISYTQ